MSHSCQLDATPALPLAAPSIEPGTNQADKDIHDNPQPVTRLILCSGQVYYDLVAEREKVGYPTFPRLVGKTAPLPTAGSALCFFCVSYLYRDGFRTPSLGGVSIPRPFVLS